MKEQTTTKYQVRVGDDVIATDGHKVGSVADVYGSYLVVEKGFLFAKDYYLPFSAVSTHDEADGKIYLAVDKDAALNSGWDQMPTVYEDATIDVVHTGAVERTSAVADTDRMSIPVHEEELIPTKTVRQAGQVRVDKDVVEERREIDVPVTEESVRVTRRSVDRVAETGDTAFREETFEVPVRTEDVGLDKVVRVAEEVDIQKQRVQDTKRVSGTVRKERVSVDDSGEVIASDQNNRWQDANTTS